LIRIRNPEIVMKFSIFSIIIYVIELCIYIFYVIDDYKKKIIYLIISSVVMLIVFLILLKYFCKHNSLRFSLHLLKKYIVFSEHHKNIRCFGFYVGNTFGRILAIPSLMLLFYIFVKIIVNFSDNIKNIQNNNKNSNEAYATEISISSFIESRLLIIVISVFIFYITFKVILNAISATITGDYGQFHLNELIRGKETDIDSDSESSNSDDKNSINESKNENENKSPNSENENKNKNENNSLTNNKNENDRKKNLKKKKNKKYKNFYIVKAINELNSRYIGHRNKNENEIDSLKNENENKNENNSPNNENGNKNENEIDSLKNENENKNENNSPNNENGNKNENNSLINNKNDRKKSLKKKKNKKHKDNFISKIFDKFIAKKNKLDDLISENKYGPTTIYDKDILLEKYFYIAVDEQLGSLCAQVLLNVYYLTLAVIKIIIIILIVLITILIDGIIMVIACASSLNDDTSRKQAQMELTCATSTIASIDAFASKIISTILPLYMVYKILNYN